MVIPRKTWVFARGETWNVGWYEPDGRKRQKSFGSKKTDANNFRKVKTSKLIQGISGNRSQSSSDFVVAEQSVSIFPAYNFNAHVVDWASNDRVHRADCSRVGHVLSYADPESESNKATGCVNIEELNKIKKGKLTRSESWGFDMTTLRKLGGDNLDKFRNFGCNMPDGFSY